MNKKEPNLLLVAVNAKYIHSNLAVYSLKKYAETHTGKTVGLAEYTINQPLSKILQDILKKEPDVLFFSCYIWNIAEIRDLISDISKVRPDIHIWLGGPEVTYDPAGTLEAMPAVKGLTRGEGEPAFAGLVEHYFAGDMDLSAIPDITYRDEEGVIRSNAPSPRMDLDDLDFVYDDLSGFEHRIIYYESSRGCPFRCSYCLSSVDKRLSFRSLDKVKQELQFFLDQKVPQVKFIDRTFNCKHERTVEIWNYIDEHDNGVTNFHFEIAADIMEEDEIAILNSMRPGLVQLEIGVQSTHPATITEIDRPMDWARVREVSEKILAPGNVHVHLDLIAGLPYEDAARFRQSFNDVISARPHQLQLGFLKVLSGSPMHARRDLYGLAYSDRSPYEVLQTKWISYDEIAQLKAVEEMVDTYYNSGQYTRTLGYLFTEGEESGALEDDFAVFEGLARWYEEHDMNNISLSRNAKYENLLEFGRSVLEEPLHEGLLKAMIYDYYARDNVRSRPAFLGEETVSKEEINDFLVGDVEHKLNRKFLHLERMDGELLVFDYQKRDPVTGNVTAYVDGE